MSSSPVAPTKPPRLGPTFAVINDVDRQIEEELGMAPIDADIVDIKETKHIDDEIDELLSENDDEMDGDEDDKLMGRGGVPMNGGSRSKGSGAGGGSGSSMVNTPPSWICRWDGCWHDQQEQDKLVEHVQSSKSSILLFSD